MSCTFFLGRAAGKYQQFPALHRALHPTCLIKCAGWDTRPSKVMSYAAFLCARGGCKCPVPKSILFKSTRVGSCSLHLSNADPQGPYLWNGNIQVSFKKLLRIKWRYLAYFVLNNIRKAHSMFVCACVCVHMQDGHTRAHTHLAVPRSSF